MRLLPYGDAAVLLDCETLAEALGWRDLLAAAAVEGVEEFVTAARTVLVRLRPDTANAAKRVIATLGPLQVSDRGEVVHGEADSEPVTISVTYDGPDLAEVGELTGLGADGVVAAHTKPLWRVAFCGFAPGFGYLVGGGERLHVPRRREPRTRVPAGAVGLAGEFSGVYPRESPGGWQLIGRTDAALWDVNQEPSASLRPGLTVRFRPR